MNDEQLTMAILVRLSQLGLDRWSTMRRYMEMARDEPACPAMARQTFIFALGTMENIEREEATMVAACKRLNGGEPLDTVIADAMREIEEGSHAHV